MLQSILNDHSTYINASPINVSSGVCVLTVKVMLVLCPHRDFQWRTSSSPLKVLDMHHTSHDSLAA